MPDNGPRIRNGGPTINPGNPSGRPTLDTVAEAAGVSRATVSRVINDLPGVRSHVRASVEEAISRLGYVPNLAARSLVTKRSGSVALVISEPESEVFSDPFFATIVRGVSDELAEFDLDLVLMMARDTGRHERIVRYARNGHVDGVLLIAMHGDDPLPGLLHAAGVPVVLGGRPVNVSDDWTYVDIDNAGGGRLAVEHLLGLGRRTVATVAGPQDMGAGRARLAGYRAAIAAAPAHREIVGYGDFTEAGGAQAMRGILDAHPEVDAVFAASDRMAIGAMAALKAAGRRVPEDVAVVGFDDSEASPFSDPPLTTVHQSTEEMSRRMVRLLRTRMDGDDARTSVVLPTFVVVRASA
jgi:DNA-binding LacI/PurR family transcriptional regulator